MLLENQVAVITGSSRGIGRAIAIRMAQEGAKVVVNGVLESRVREVVQEIRSNDGTAIGVAKSVETMDGGGIDHFGSAEGVRKDRYPGE
ncbi:MAG: SDR family NAD(P)-dependent oxidoreductase [Paenibacillaceae bacterium]